MPTWWYIQDEGRERGPVPFRELVEMVRRGEVTAEHRVRDNCLNQWQWADAVPGLFYMARRAAAHETPHKDPGPQACAAPADAAASSAAEQESAAREQSRPPWLERYLAVGALRRTQRNVRGPRAASGSRAQHRPATASTSAKPERAWSNAIESAVECLETGARKRRLHGGRLLEFVGRVSAVFATARTAGILKPTFRIACAMLAGNLAGWWIVHWKQRQALRFPTAELHSGSMRWPLLGECNALASVLLFGAAVLLIAAAGWWGAKWLEEHARDA